MLIALLPGEVVVQSQHIEAITITNVHDQDGISFHVTTYLASGKTFDRDFGEDFDKAKEFYNSTLRMLESLERRIR